MENEQEPRVMEQIIEKEVKFKLTPEEKNKMADMAAELSAERNRLASEFAEQSKATRSVLKAKQLEIDRLLACHKNGIEVREVKVTEHFNYTAGVVKYFHNNEVIEEREMVGDEKQMKLADNPTRKIKKKGKKPTKVERDPAKNLTPEELKAKDLADVHKLETGRKTKRSAVDRVSP